MRYTLLWHRAEFVRVNFADSEQVLRTISRKDTGMSQIDRDRPIFLDDVSYQVLSMVTGHLFRLSQYPESLQAGRMGLPIVHSLHARMLHALAVVAL